MKKLLLIFGIVLLGSLLMFSCNSDQDESDFEKSFQAWLSFKKSSDNSYFYVVRSWSFIGFRGETKITVLNGIVSKREFVLNDLSGQSEIPEREGNWIEELGEIGSHEAGAEPMTLDEVYEKAENVWLKGVLSYGSSDIGVKITFETENNGLISVCGVTPKTC